MTKVCLITGATGFIGQNLVSELVAGGRKVIALGKANEKYCSSVLNDKPLKISTTPFLTPNTFLQNDVQFSFGDIADESFIQNVFSEIIKNGFEIEYVIHLAACATIQQAAQEEKQTWRINYLGTENVLKQSLKYQKKYPTTFKSFFYASTDKVYGEGTQQTYQETDVLNPLVSPYDQSKAKADILVQNTAKKNNFPAVIYRFCNVYGPGDYHKTRIIPGTLYRLIYTKDVPLLKVYRDSKGQVQSFYRDMIYVKDLTHAIHLLLKHLDTKKYSLIGEVFNLGTENSYAMNDVIKEISTCMDKIYNPAIEEINAGEIKNQCMNYAKLNKLLGFSPRYTLSKGIQETVKWYVERKEEINEWFA